jgi:hypothetical protein
LGSVPTHLPERRFDPRALKLVTGKVIGWECKKSIFIKSKLNYRPFPVAEPNNAKRKSQINPEMAHETVSSVVPNILAASSGFAVF